MSRPRVSENVTSLITVAATAMVVIMAFIIARGCQRSGTSSPQPQSLPTFSMPLGNRTFTLQIANSEATRETGLMYRDSMPADQGMIFVFDEAAPLAFWMKNTHIPLDIVYLDASGKIISIKSMKPYDLSSVPSDGPAKFAIELNQGAASAAGLKVGDVVKIPPDVANSAR